LMELKNPTNCKKVASICKTGYQIVYQTSLQIAHYINDLDSRPLPRVLAIDEFKATRDCEGAMAFIAMNWESGQIHTILEDRRSHKLLEFFNGYSYEERCKVEFVVMDMNAAYDSMVKKAFPKAQIVIDRFHIVQHLTNAFKMIRIQEMNKLNRHSGEEAKKYRRLKRFWRLSQKDYSCLSSESKYYPLFDRYISAQDIALELANYSPVLKETWEFYQLLLGYFKDRNAD
ncbi:transposase, partial [Streptococcus danieliae]|nr:transposase [Streptococcus danieliae]NYS49860.1 transposase [Streptococcus danieliae]